MHGELSHQHSLQSNVHDTREVTHASYSMVRTMTQTYLNISRNVSKVMESLVHEQAIFQWLAIINKVL